MTKLFRLFRKIFTIFLILLLRVYRQNKISIYFAASILFISSLVGYFGHESLINSGFTEPASYIKYEVTKVSAFQYFLHNIRVTIRIIIHGVLTIGVGAGVHLLLNGLIIGETIFVALEFMSFSEVLFRIIPHGIFEIPAIILSGTGGFITTKLFIDLLKSKKVNIFTELKNIKNIIIVIIILLFLAGIVESSVNQYKGGNTKYEKKSGSNTNIFVQPNNW